ncbi:MAG TPA: hypothetical protein VGK67_03190 [Myxococcales bacterium]|jgi:hypothetical protein
MSERQIEMLWKCTSCGARNLGRHSVCPSCKNPKDGSEEWFMPDDTAAAPTVTDPALLALATAGAHWRCGFCGSDQRSDDGACKSCGASKKEGTSLDALDEPAAAVPDPAARAASAPAAAPPRPKATPRQMAIAFACMVLSCGGCGACIWHLGKPEILEARVASVAWEQRVKVDRWQVVGHEGFAEARPPQANGVKSLGPREHHREQVVDHYETEHYTVKEQDGTKTETYTERESCGETCTTSSKSCSEKCTPNKNGFATCKTTCSGGSRSCKTKYCDKRKTRQVTKYKDVRKSRQVPRYRSEPRYAEYFSWKAWEWKPNRVVKAAGAATTDLRWPADEEINAGVRLEEGETERSAREACYRVDFVAPGKDGDRSFPHVCATPEEFLRYPVGSPHRLRVQGQELVEIDPGRDAR